MPKKSLRKAVEEDREVYFGEHPRQSKRGAKSRKPPVRKPPVRSPVHGRDI